MTGNRGPRASPRLRTIANLVEWVAVGVLLLLLVGLVPLLGIVLAPYAAGGIIGDRVERWPGWVAASAVAVWSLWWLSRTDDVWIFVGLLFVSLLVSVTTARYRWRPRPKALSAPPSR